MFSQATLQHRREHAGHAKAKQRNRNGHVDHIVEVQRRQNARLQQFKTQRCRSNRAAKTQTRRFIFARIAGSSPMVDPPIWGMASSTLVVCDFQQHYVARQPVSKLPDEKMGVWGRLQAAECLSLVAPLGQFGSSSLVQPADLA